MKTLYGAVSWTVYSFRGKVYHLLGDVHVDYPECQPGCDIPVSLGADLKTYWETESAVPTASCTSVSLLLKTLANHYASRQQGLDIFLESSYRVSDVEFSENDIRSRHRGGQLSKVISSFNRCLRRSKKQCPYYPYIRFHYTDSRTVDYYYNLDNYSTFVTGYAGNLEVYYSVLLGTSTSSREILTSEMTKERRKFYHLVYILWYKEDLYWKILFLKLTSNNFSEDLRRALGGKFEESPEMKDEYDSILRSELLVSSNKHLLKRELEKLSRENKELPGLIVSYFMEKYSVLGVRKALSDMYEMNLREAKGGIHFLLRNDLNYLQKILPIISFLNTVEADVYTMTRMFRSFYPPSSMSIVYFGQIHIQTYKDFFEQYLGLSPIRELESPRACIQYEDEYLG